MICLMGIKSDLTVAVGKWDEEASASKMRNSEDSRIGYVADEW